MPWLLNINRNRYVNSSIFGNRKAAVAVLFALLALPLCMMVGLAIDFSFLMQAKAQLNLAADAAAIHAVRVASQAYANGQTTTAAIQQAGQVAGQQWFAAQLGSFSLGTVTPTVNVSYSPSPSVFTAVVSYSGAVPTKFSGLFNINLFPVAGSATTTISDSYDEIIMLLDNSSSMLIGASLSDITALERATPCSTQGVNEGQNMANNYSWTYTGNYGYNSWNTPPPAVVNGNCNTLYDGDPSACPYAPNLPNISPTNPYQCTNGGGSPATVNGVNYPNMPNAPCAFACHNNSNNNDYYGLARSLQPPVQLRLDVVQQAAANVVKTLQNDQGAPNQFSVGIYQFTTSLQQIYPPSGSGEASTNLTAAYNAAVNLKNTPNLSNNAGNTDLRAPMTSLSQIVSTAGNGLSAATPLKNLFIVTDGMEDAGWSVGPMTTTTNEQICSLLWQKGFTVYVLYTPYYPLPNPFYLANDKGYVEPTSSSPNVAALKACARYPGNFFQASDPTAINTAMQSMLATALNSPGRISK